MKYSILLIGLLLPAACGTTPAAEESISPREDPRSDPPRPPLATPWPDTFREPAILVANDVHIEGPPGLREHFALRIESEFHERLEEVRDSGYFQRVTIKPGGIQVEIHSYLDALELVALQNLTVLERPGLVDVVVLAEGDVYWRETRSGRERRESSLRLVGRVPR